jgi:peptidoglycan/xylan/chitin deacetylase (PgdA/CDA1 family)
MRIPGLKTARLTARRLLERSRSGVVVLGYHRVSDDLWDPFGIGVRVRHFMEQMEVLAQVALPARLEDLVGPRARSPPPRRSVAVTFDDAYSECLHVVAPATEGLGIPITVFAIAGWLGREPWWERLARIVAPASRWTGAIELETDRGVESFRARGGSVADRTALARAIHRAIADVGVDRRTHLLDTLEERLGAGRSDAPCHRLASPGELRELARCEGVTLGAHGDTHVKLSGSSPDVLSSEVDGARRALDRLLGRPVEGFSYPHGSLDRAAREGVERAGFRFACSSRPGCVLPESDPYELPRIWAPDVDGARFRRWLRGWVGA